MTALRQALADYLTIRRAMGYRLARAENVLGQFLTYLEERGKTRLRVDAKIDSVFITWVRWCSSTWSV